MKEIYPFFVVSRELYNFFGSKSIEEIKEDFF